MRNLPRAGARLPRLLAEALRTGTTGDGARDAGRPSRSAPVPRHAGGSAATDGAVSGEAAGGGDGGKDAPGAPSPTPSPPAPPVVAFAAAAARSSATTTQLTMFDIVLRRSPPSRVNTLPGSPRSRTYAREAGLRARITGERPSTSPARVRGRPKGRRATARVGTARDARSWSRPRGATATPLFALTYW